MWYLRLLAPKRKNIMHAGAATINLNAPIPLRSADTELRNAIKWQHTTVGHILWTQHFQCRKCFNKCKLINAENYVEPLIRLRAQSEVEPITPETVARASLFFTAPEAPFTGKIIMFRANPNIWIGSMIYVNEAFLRGFLQIRSVEALLYYYCVI